MDALAERVGWTVENTTFLVQSLAHRSFCAEHPGFESNERLEFLGDAVLGVVVTDHLFGAYPDLPEGELAKVRASLVNSAALADLAAELRLGEALLLGKGEDASGGRNKPSILADALEAVIGALYLDRGRDIAEEVVLAILGSRVAVAAAGPGEEDYKTRLQELCAARLDELPDYEVSEDGPDHAKVFAAAVTVGGRRCGAGRGRSKKQAEQAAARSAWLGLTDDPGAGPEAAADTSESLGPAAGPG